MKQLSRNNEKETISMEESAVKAENTSASKQKKKEKKKKPAKHWWKHVDVNNGRRSFASGLNIYKLIWIFIIASFIGVVFETFYVYSATGVLMRRSGMLYGPFNQIYGMGAVIFSVLLYRFKDKSGFVIFAASAIMGGAFEYVCSWVQEIMFGSVSWEYSKMPMNIGGRTNLFYAFGWGIMGLVFITHIWPFLSEMIERIPNSIGKSVTLVCTIFFVINLSLSALAVHRFHQRHQSNPPVSFVGVWLDRVYPDEYMRRKYPSMQFVTKTDSEANPSSAPNKP